VAQANGIALIADDEIGPAAPGLSGRLALQALFSLCLLGLNSLRLSRLDGLRLARPLVHIGLMLAEVTLGPSLHLLLYRGAEFFWVVDHNFLQF